MRIGFLKEFHRHLIDGERTDLSELEKRDLKLRKRGGDIIYGHLVSLIIREGWDDHKGFPLKEKFHKQGYLVCCIATRRLIKITTYSNRTVQECLKEMEALGHIYKNNEHTLKGQTVYILGTWKTVKNSKGEDVTVEELFRYKARDNYIKQKKNKPKEEELTISDLDALYPGGMEAYFGRP